MTPRERAAAALQAWAGDELGLVVHLQAQVYALEVRTANMQAEQTSLVVHLDFLQDEAVRLHSLVESLETESTVWRNRADALREAYRNALNREVALLSSQEGQEPEGEPPPKAWDAPCACGHLHDEDTATGKPWPSCGLLGCDCQAYRAEALQG